MPPVQISLHLFVALSELCLLFSFSCISHSLNPRLHETTLCWEIRSKWIHKWGIFFFSLCSVFFLLPLFPLWFSFMKAEQSDRFPYWLTVKEIQITALTAHCSSVHAASGEKAEMIVYAFHFADMRILKASRDVIIESIFTMPFVLVIFCVYLWCKCECRCLSNGRRCMCPCEYICVRMLRWDTCLCSGIWGKPALWWEADLVCVSVSPILRHKFVSRPREESYIFPIK